MLSFNKFILEMDLYHGSTRGLPRVLNPKEHFFMTPDLDLAIQYANREDVKVDADDVEELGDSIIKYAVNKANLPIEMVDPSRKNIRSMRKSWDDWNVFNKEIQSSLDQQVMPKKMLMPRYEGKRRQLFRAFPWATGGMGGRLHFNRRVGDEVILKNYERPRRAIYPIGAVYLDEPRTKKRSFDFHPLPLPDRKAPPEWIGNKFAGKLAGKVVPPGAPVIRPFYRPGISVSAVRGIPMFGEKRMGELTANETNPLVSGMFGGSGAPRAKGPITPSTSRKSLGTMMKLISDIMRVNEQANLIESKIFNRLVNQLKAKGLPAAKAYATANKRLKAYGIKDSKGKLTKKGKQRNAMSAGERAKDREAKRQGKSPKSFTYNKKTNRATLKNK